MDKRTQVISIFFSVFFIIAVLGVIALESANLTSSGDISRISNSFTLTDNAYQSLISAYQSSNSLGLSPAAAAILEDTIAEISNSYFINYHLNLSLESGLSSPASSLTGQPFIEEIPLTIDNTQNAGESTFQQMINITSSDPGWSYISKNPFGQNVEFLYPNGQVIPSWLQSNTSNSGVWWIKLESLPANSIIKIYMAFAPTNVNLFNGNTIGEASTLPVSAPQHIQEYIPVTISNSQSSATVSPFDEEINVPSSDYSSYAASNLQNVEFYYRNGTIIPSWLETQTSSNAIWWLKLGSIPASSSITVYMGFASTSTNLFNTVNDGEAPQLSPSYAEYDDGFNVFNFYDDFRGTVLNGSKWAIFSGASGYNPIVVNNGLLIFPDSSQGSGGYGIFLKYRVYGPIEFSAYQDLVSGSTSWGKQGIGLINTNEIPSNGDFMTVYSSSTGWYDNYATTGLGNSNSGNQPIVATYPIPYDTFSLISVALANTSDSMGYLNNAFEAKNPVAYEFTSSTIPATPFIVSDANAGLYRVYYAFVSQYPLNGVMPSASFGSAETAVSYGEYDNGANVFNFYDNFAGTTLSSKWASGTSGGTITVDNGLTETIPYNAATGSYTYISTSTYEVTSPVVVESYANLNGFDTTNFRMVPVALTQYNNQAWHADNSENENGGGWVGNAFQNNGVDAETTTSSSVNGFVNSNYISSNTNYNIFGVIYPDNGAFSVSYNSLSEYASTTSLVPATPLYITISNWLNPSQSAILTTYPVNVEWIRVRAYPPNGVMPSVTFG